MGVKRLSVIVFAALAFGSISAAAPSESEDDILIIVNNSVADTTLGMERLRTIFLRQRTYWGSGNKIFPINAKPDSHLREAFREYVLCMSMVDEWVWWRDEGIRNGLLPPVEFKETQRAVHETQYGIGYVFRRNYIPGSASIVASFPTR